jgi:hypothetical protein
LDVLIIAIAVSFLCGVQSQQRSADFVPGSDGDGPIWATITTLLQTASIRLTHQTLQLIAERYPTHLISTLAINGLLEEDDDVSGDVDDKQVFDAALIASGSRAL